MTLEKGLDAIDPLSALYKAELDGMVVCGIGMMAVGLIIVLVAFLFDVGVDTASLVSDLGVNVPSQVANIDKISIREMILQSGGFVFIGGIILFAAGSIKRSVLNALSSHRQSSQTDSQSAT